MRATLSCRKQNINKTGRELNKTRTSPPSLILQPHWHTINSGDAMNAGMWTMGIPLYSLQDKRNKRPYKNGTSYACINSTHKTKKKQNKIPVPTRIQKCPRPRRAANPFSLPLPTRPHPMFLGVPMSLDVSAWQTGTQRLRRVFGFAIPLQLLKCSSTMARQLLTRSARGAPRGLVASLFPPPWGQEDSSFPRLASPPGPGRFL